VLLLFVLMTVSVPIRSEDTWLPFDTSPPVGSLSILDPLLGWRETTTLIEDRPYAFDASGTTDDSLVQPEDVVNLTFLWNFGDGEILGPGMGGAPDRLLNVTHTYARFGVYTFNLTVWDAAGNAGGWWRTMVIQGNVSARPDLRLRPGTIEISPPSPATGAEVRVRLAFENLPGHGPARQVRVEFALLIRGRDSNLTVSRLRVFDATGAPIQEVEAGGVANLEFVVLAPAAGRHNARVRVWDAGEPPEFIDASNQEILRFTVTTDGTGYAIGVVGFTSVAMVATVAWLRRLDAGRFRRSS